MRILFLSRWYPYPANNGSKLRILALLKGLSVEHEVTLISFYAPSDGEPDLRNLESICRKVIPVARKDFNPGSLKSRLGFFSLTPRSVSDTYSPEVESHLNAELSGGSYELVIASQFDMALYAGNFQGLPAVFEEAEVGIYHDRYQNAMGAGERFRHGLTWWKHSRYLMELMDQFAVCTVVSDQEREILKYIYPGYKRVEVIPNCVNLDDYDKISGYPPAVPNRMIFIGSLTFEPNYQAMIWFVTQVFPKVLEKHPDIELVITGDHGQRSFPSQTNVKLTGYVEDIRPYIVSSWFSLAPIHFGGGTRLKILKSMALCTPVIATPKGAEGLAVEHGKHLLIAKDPDEFAAACCQLLESPAYARVSLKTHLRSCSRIIIGRQLYPAILIWWQMQQKYRKVLFHTSRQLCKVS